MKAETHGSGSQSNGSSGVDLKAVCRSLLKIVARLEDEDTLRQTAEVELDDLADPASDSTTSQG